MLAERVDFQSRKCWLSNANFKRQIKKWVVVMLISCACSNLRWMYPERLKKVFLFSVCGVAGNTLGYFHEHCWMCCVLRVLPEA